MSRRNKSATAVSKISSASAPAVSSLPQTSQKSSITQSLFAPSRYQLNLFASVIQGFESEHLRVHDTTTGSLRCEHPVSAGTKITCLDFGFYTQPNDSQKDKKRKRENVDEKRGTPIVAFGTSTNNICFLSTAEDKVLYELAGGHSRGIRDFKFNHENLEEAWSIGGDNKLVQWNTSQQKPLR